VVKTVEKAPVTEIRLQTEVSHTTLREGDTYDVASIRIRAVDGRGNLLRFYQGPVRLRTQGPIEIIGPEIVTLRGGCGGTYVKTTGEPGQADITLENDQMGQCSLTFEIIKEE
jgi:beta-galactosidase